MVFQLDTGPRAEVVCRSLLDGDHAFYIIGGVSMNALEREHSNLEIDSKLNRQPVKTYKWRCDVFMSWQWAFIATMFRRRDRSFITSRRAGVFRKVRCIQNFTPPPPAKKKVTYENQGAYKQRARCAPFRQANSVIMPSISITSLWSYAELQENSISSLSWSFVKEFAVPSYRWSYAHLCMLTQDKSAKLWELHILRDRIGAG